MTVHPPPCGNHHQPGSPPSNGASVSGPATEPQEKCCERSAPVTAWGPRRVEHARLRDGHRGQRVPRVLGHLRCLRVLRDVRQPRNRRRDHGNGSCHHLAALRLVQWTRRTVPPRDDNMLMLNDGGGENKNVR